MANRNTLHTRGNRPCTGSVDLSGNSNTAIAIITKALFTDKEVQIDNIPRSKRILDFISILQRVDTKISWLSDTKIRLETKFNETSHDISFITLSDNYEYGRILIPIMISKFQKCVVSEMYKSELDEYKSYGLKIEKIEDEKLEVSIPLDYKPKPKHIDISMMTDLEKIIKNYQKFFYKDLTIVSNAKDHITNVIKESVWEKVGDVVVNIYNQNEFNLFASIPIITKGELKLRNFNLSESLGFLMSLSELGSEYEVLGNELKIWRTKFHQKEYYDYSGNRYQEVGLLLIILSSRITKQVAVEVSKSNELLDLVKELNIMGCKIEFTIDSNRNWIELNVKPALITTVKMSIQNKSHAESIILASVASSGNSVIKGLDSILETTPYLYDNLLSLGINLNIK